MAAHTHVAVGYNVQIAIDAKHKLIVEQQATNQVVDMGLLAQTAEPGKQVLGVERIAVVAVSRKPASRLMANPRKPSRCRSPIRRVQKHPRNVVNFKTSTRFCHKVMD